MLEAVTRKKEFPSLEGMTYLNTAAEGIPPTVVGAALGEYFRDHQMGMEGRKAHFAKYELLKEQVAGMYGLRAADIGICSCTSEAFNLASLALRLREGDEVIVNDLEFPSGATPWLQPNSVATVKLWRNRDGRLRVEDLVPLLGPKTRFVPVSLVSFYNGFKVDLPAIVEAVRKHSPALTGLDVTQGLGRVTFDARGVDLIVSSTHKWILATHGGGLVGIPEAARERWRVPAGGWFNIEDAFGPERFERAAPVAGAGGFSVGMPNFPAVYAVCAALQFIGGVGVQNIVRAAQPLVHACIEGLSQSAVELITPREPDSLAGIVAFRHAKFERINQHLLRHNIHVMAQAGRMRVSLHGYNTAEDVEQFLRRLREALDDA